ncbi:MAG TPA: TMEM175 family protein [Planctomycetota bacterium]|nr:TMEM175 family protein [Planctomycetota bacterium]
MTKGRLEAFSDGVIAVLITILVLELKFPEGHVPDGTSFEALRPMLSSLCYYVLSFVYLGIYWNNHHHMLHTATKVTGGILWANLHLLFWLSLVPFLTAWMGDSHLAAVPTAAYAVDLLGAAFAYWILQNAIIASEGPESKLAKAVGKDWKGKLSQVLYLGAVVLAFVQPYASVAIYVLVALIWLVPDRRIEKHLAE